MYFFFREGPDVQAVGATLVSGPFLNFGGGLQIEYLFEALDMQAGIASNFKDKGQVHLSVGFLFFSLEYGYLFFGDAPSNHAITGKIRFPIGTLYKLFSRH